MADRALALFAYAFPHRKSHDFIVDLAAAGWRRVCIIAAPWHELPNVDRTHYFADRVTPAPSRLAADLSAALGYVYAEFEHNDAERLADFQREHGFDAAIVAGARILPRRIIDLFPKGIVNFHPGKIPETSGLDSFFYSIRNNVPMGVTTHLIDHRVDAGQLLFFEELALEPGQGPGTVSENLYQLQRSSLRRLLDAGGPGALAATPLDRPAKNEPMSAEQKWSALATFPRWLAYHSHCQRQARLFAACERGDLAAARGLLDEAPALLSQANDRGWTPLIVAAFNQHLDLVEHLLERGADPNACGRRGTTVLMYAKTAMLGASDGDYRLLDLLVGRGADPARKDSAGLAVIDYVERAGDDRMAAHLRALGA